MEFALGQNGYGHCMIASEDKILYLSSCGFILNNKSGGNASATFGTRTAGGTWLLKFLSASFNNGSQHQLGFAFPRPIPIKYSEGGRLTGYTSVVNCSLTFWGAGWELNEENP